MRQAAIRLACVLGTASLSFAQPTWTAAGPKTAAHTQHPATLLPDGRVLVIGTLSCNSGCVSGAAADLYDPASNTWAAAASPRLPRFNHVAALLPNGKVLVAAGYLTPGVLTATAQLYDPATATWSSTGSLTTPRQFHRSAILADGRVLVAGGLGMDGQGGFTPLRSAEVYDPSTGRWTPAGNMSVARWSHSVTTLADGRVLVMGGTSSAGDTEPPLGSAEIYNPTTNSWTRAADLLTARSEHRAALLPDGRILAAGGYGATDCLSTAELYDPAADRWTATGAMTGPRIIFDLTLLPSGMLLAAGGGSCSGVLNTAELYNPGIGTWSPAADLTQARLQASATVLSSGKVLLAGGQSGADHPSGVPLGTPTSELYGVREVASGGIVTVSAASFFDNGAVAPESLATAFGSNLAPATEAAQGAALPLTLGGVSVTVQDSTGAPWQAPLVAVSPGQISFEIPAKAAAGVARITLGPNAAASASGTVLIARVAPGVFSADSSGQGWAAAIVQRIRADGTQSYEPVAQFDPAQNRFTAIPVDLGPNTDSVFLVLFGTGIRGRSGPSGVTARLGAATVPAAFAGPSPQFPGVDQVNLLLPRSLAGSGDVGVAISVDGFAANTVRVNIK